MVLADLAATDFFPPGAHLSFINLENNILCVVGACYKNPAAYDLTSCIRLDSDKTSGQKMKETDYFIRIQPIAYSDPLYVSISYRKLN